MWFSEHSEVAVQHTPAVSFGTSGARSAVTPLVLFRSLALVC